MRRSFTERLFGTGTNKQTKNKKKKYSYSIHIPRISCISNVIDERFEDTAATYFFLDKRKYMVILGNYDNETDSIPSIFALRE